MTATPAPSAEGTPYPLVLRTPTYAWWQPAAGLVLLPIAMFIVVPLLLLPLLAATVAADHTGSFSKAFEAAASLDPVSWQGLLYLNLSLAGLTLVTWGIVRFVHGVRPRWLTSVAPGFRWRFFWACFGLSVVAILAQILVGALMPSDPNDLGGSLNHVDATYLALAAVVLFSTPLQAIGEEYVFRGYLMQAFGALTRRPWIAVVASAFLFACAHGVQNAPLFLDRFAFGLMAGYVVLRTGGLEAGIALHVWNNLVAFGLALAIGDIDDTLNVTEVGWSNLPLTITQNGVYLILVLLVAHRMGITSRTTHPVLVAGSPRV
ncbi:CPBP family intramembrane metalloprotease [Nocardioides marmoriginsengisoli]|uniref:CPBP family intramembrane metalloprotease n=1 Tax=Nocardioides marmoriginsengisoli TaxID=661483 RepID=A0A3N0CQJ4_9ACTN|nr:CPBP family intramembrane glutamic endopeptidase [Nocardioides marmoriginsengisoli]RNL65173.1 CPBP family intramembrane metalloprotease [Nocardioides marmoriginsengisoli]